MVLHALHLCSGYAGFELALRLAGIPAVTVAHVERDSYAAAVLVARMADQTLDQAPVWSDLDTFDPEPFVGRVDLVTAGLPCQPFSGAGQRKGLDDDRHLWPMARRIIAHVGPRLVLLENVPDVVSAGWLPHVCADLADLGFDAEWGLLSAAAVGAPHQRQRFWLLANAAGEGRVGRDADRWFPALEPTEVVGDVGDTRRPRRPEVTGGTPRHETADAGWATHVADGASQDVADTAGARRDELVGTVRVQQEQPQPRSDGRDMADTDGARCEGFTITGLRPAVTGPPRRRFPPGPADTDGWRRWIAEGGPQPQVRRRTDGRPLGLADALHLGGNGLVPAVAAHALLQLAARAGVTL